MVVFRRILWRFKAPQKISGQEVSCSFRWPQHSLKEDCGNRKRVSEWFQRGFERLNRFQEVPEGFICVSKVFQLVLEEFLRF